MGTPGSVGGCVLLSVIRYAYTSNTFNINAGMYSMMALFSFEEGFSEFTLNSLSRWPSPIAILGQYIMHRALQDAPGDGSNESQNRSRNSLGGWAKKGDESANKA